MSLPRKVCIVGGSRTPFCKSGTHYADLSLTKLMTTAMKGLVKSYNLYDKVLGDVALGAVLKHSKNFSLAREAVLDSGLSPYTPGVDLQRACGTGLEAAIMIGNKIAMGQIEVGIAGGVDTNSDVPIELKSSFANRLVKTTRTKGITDKIKLWSDFKPTELLPKIPSVTEPRTGKSMGDHCELMAQEWSIAREDQDELAFLSHENTTKAYTNEFFKDLITPCAGVKRDSIFRADTSQEKLAKLRPAFERSEKGTLTAGNSSPLTDGASAVLLCSEEWAKENDLEVMAYLTYSKVAAVDYAAGDGLLMAPTVAVSEMLDDAGLTLQDFDFYEIHEAFAAQVLCTLAAWNDIDYCKKFLGRDQVLGEIDRSKLNVNGGSIAIGHPFAATGGRIVASLAKMLHQKGSGRGLISICTAGGMGVTAIIEK